MEKLDNKELVTTIMVDQENVCHVIPVGAPNCTDYICLVFDNPMLPRSVVLTEQEFEDIHPDLYAYYNRLT